MDTVRSSVVHLQAESQIKIAVIKGSIPADTDLVSTHQPRQCFPIERPSQEPHISFGLVLPDKLFPESSKGHVRNGQQIGKNDSKAVTQFAPIVLLDDHLRWRQERPS